ncbi:MAG TPA: sulfotransferase, partial [Thermomicrobiales bacterium]|nr:sulfotransferase [Thermomicrobiales bacterium]
MNDGAAPRPIFVIGSLRSGASLLAASLGQHRDIVLAPDAAWLEQAALGLRQAFAEDAGRGDLSWFAALGIDDAALFAQIGAAIDRLLLASATSLPTRADDQRPTRWVDGCYTHAFAVAALHLLFPEARFIHVVRPVEDVVAALTDPAAPARFKSRYVPFTPLDACEHWLDAVGSGLDAERALGSAIVQRVAGPDLVAAPEAALRRCLTFLEEPFDPACLRPFRGVAQVRQRVDGADERWASVPNAARIEAAALCRASLDGERRYAPDEWRRAALFDAFRRRADRR